MAEGVGAAVAEPRPAVSVYAAHGPTTGVALVLPGGAEKSFRPTRPRNVEILRMRPVARALHRAGRRRGLAVWVVRYRYRGWNGEHSSPVADARWALDEVRRRHGDVPVVLVGHSMGGRTALRVADHPQVRGVVALAPWVPEGEPVDPVAGRTVVLMHGTLDVTTRPSESLQFAQRSAPVAERVARVVVRGDGHAMLLRWSTWHRFAIESALGILGLVEHSEPVDRALRRGAVRDFAVRV